jgi:alpha-ribazole phosphatase
MMNDVTRIFLIRHGDTLDEETKKIYKGTLDIPLSEKGKSRIERVGTFLSRFHLDHVYTSALSRCTESGSIIARTHDLSISVMKELNEIHFGSWEGLSFDEIAVMYPDDFREWLADPEIHSPPGGETLRDAAKRINAALNRIISDHRGQNVAVVAHAGVLRIILCSVLDMRLSLLFRLGQDYGGISIIDIYDDDNATVKLLNFTFYP